MLASLEEAFKCLWLALASLEEAFKCLWLALASLEEAFKCLWLALTSLEEAFKCLATSPPTSTLSTPLRYKAPMPHAHINGHDIYYELHGEGSAEPAVLIMGLGVDAHGWERQLPALTHKRKVLVLDNRGVGRSAKPEGPYSTAELADDVAGVLDAVGLSRAHVAGLSLGGMIAQQFALRHAQRVRSLALLATYGAADTATQKTADEAAGKVAGQSSVSQAMAAMAAGNASLNPMDVMKFLMPLSFSMDFLTRESAYLQSFFIRSMSYGISDKGLAGQIGAALAHDVLEELKAISVPTMVATGTADKLIAPRNARRLAETIPGARLHEIEGGTHGLNFEHAEALNELLAGWFEEHD